jgi:superfamily II DNA/RNA helicase
MAPEMRKIADKFLSNPKTVSVSPPASTGQNITHSLVRLPTTDDWQKREALRHLLRGEKVQNAFIFCNRKRDVALLHKSLGKHGFNVGALHGDLDQSTRTETLDAFRAGTISLLVCSDVAARGLDIADVSHVFNFDVPFNAEDYVHRIGRTGRAGKSGRAFTFVTPEEGKLVAAIESLIKQDIENTVIPDLPEPRADLSPRGRTGRNSGPSDRHERRKQSSRTRHPRPETDVQKVLPEIPSPLPQKAKSPKASKGGEAFGEHLPAFLRPRSVARSK